MTVHRQRKRLIVRCAIFAALVLVIGWLALITSQWLFRKQAEALLADIKSLEINRSSSADAQKLMARWGKWGESYGDCGKGDCHYGIRIYHLAAVYPPFVFEEGPHIATRILEFLGIRSAEVNAGFDLAHGIVVRKSFEVSVPLPVRQWITPASGFWLKVENGSGYWPSLDVASQESSNLQYSNAYQFAKHPNRGFIQRRIELVANFTPEESAEEQAALLDFHFDCITRRIACSNRGELLPQAEKEFTSDIAAVR